MKPNTGNFRARFVAEFEFSPDEAARILADPEPKSALMTHLEGSFPKPDEDGIIGGHNSDALREALGKFLATRKIAEVLQLGAPSNPPIEA